MKKFVSVAVRDVARNFDKLYTYSVPNDLVSDVEVGIRVKVPFGKSNKSLEAFVMDFVEAADIDIDLSIIKDILSVGDKLPLVDDDFIMLAKEIKEKFICTYYDALRIMLPIFSPYAKEKKIKAVVLAKSHEEIIEEIENNRFNRIQQIRVLEILLDNEYVSLADIMIFAGVSRGVISTLQKNGYIDIIDIEVKRQPLSHIEVQKSSPLVPTAEQAEVLSYCNNIINHGKFEEVLLHGVTGSGKTEVYLQLIETAISISKKSIVLVPEISLTPQMVNRFKARFGDKIAVLHSRLSPGERYDQWRAIKEGQIWVAIGARSAIFAPFKDLGVVIIDEEHEPSYKSEVTPKYDAREIAKIRCKKSNALLLYGSATPSLDTYFEAQNGVVKLLEMTKRPQNFTLPDVELVDMRKELQDGNRSMFSYVLALEIEKNIQALKQTILFLNRRGFASFMLCRACGKEIACRHCNISMTYHLNSNRLICHYCGFTIPTPNACPKCNSKNIKSFGVGTQKIEAEVNKRFNCSVIRMDMDTTTTKNAHEILLKKFKEENVNVLIGTQMIAKGHDFPTVTLVGVLAADTLLYTGDFRATERTFQLLTQVAGRAGRGEFSGKVVIQSYNVDHYSIICATKHDYKAFYDMEISLREKMKYPPFTNIGVIIVSGVDDKKTYNSAMAIYENAKKNKFDISQPLRSPLSKIKDHYRWRIVIKCEDKSILRNIMTDISDNFYKGNKISDIDLSVDINPFNML